MRHSTLSPDTVIGAAIWAPYLINGDESGLDATELELIDSWLIRRNLARCDFVDVSEPHFSWAYGWYTGDSIPGGEIAEYTYYRARLEA